jgi:alpha-mannosidase
MSLGLGMLEALRASRIFGGSVGEEILKILSRALEPIDAVPGVESVTAVEMIFKDLGELLAIRWDRGYVASVYGPKTLEGSSRDFEDIRDRDLDRSIDEAYSIFIEGLKDLVSRYPKEGDIIVLGHCHIDLAWLWPYSETRRKILRSFANVLRLVREGYSFTYVQSSPQYYSWVESYPEIFERVDEEIKKGSGSLWEECGSSPTQI